MSDVTTAPVAATAAQSFSRRWIAWLAVLLAVGVVVILILFAGLRSLGMLAVGMASAVVSPAAAFLATRGLRGWVSLLKLILSPIAALVTFALAGLLWVVAASAAAWVLAGLPAGPSAT